MKKIKRYQSLFEAKTYSLEFFVKNKKVYVIYNKEPMLFQEFWKLPWAEKVLKKLYDLLKKEHPQLFQTVLTNIRSAKDWRIVLLNFINLHWNILDRVPDVLIGPGFAVDFNFER